ncbi:TonB-dependent receptor [Lentisphaera profundi]|uniref:TonB-dependent receptor n=1 Tax=Lentisphaera profundi TaxID=1658616 RepID=A0ABY7W246_9BACT|nr:TonB-dependent receptor [Lentisphaera profundi]WDE99086.1 TonB-dependent receptor [Lentisphaera profundi]
MSNVTEPLSTMEKALEVNLDNRIYGTFAEIGAGQEVVRWFFQAGASAGTIAKSISAYDMVVSDSIYGKCQRYVGQQRLQDMLDYEYDLNIKRLEYGRGDSTCFFSFADTVSARNFSGTNKCHGWLGIKFQSRPGDDFSQIIIHVNLKDKTNSLQQEALGIVGVNLIHAAFHLAHRTDDLLESLLDNLSRDRIEIDMVEFKGIEFRRVDNRLMLLHLVKLGLSDAAMFGPDKSVLLPSSVFYKKSVVVERGSFRPVCNVNIDIMETALEQFSEDIKVDRDEIIPIMEITMNNLMQDCGSIDLHDFLARADMLAASGYKVLISNYKEYYRLGHYLRMNTNRPVAIAMGASSLIELFNYEYYQNLEGGILEAMGRLFKHQICLYVYPWLYKKELITVETFKVEPRLQLLFDFIKQHGKLKDITSYNPDFLPVYSRKVLKKIANGEAGWEDDVPEAVAEVIKKRKYFLS